MDKTILDTLQLVVFDFDGLLVNSEEIIQACWKKTCDYYHYQVPSDFFDRISGISRDTTLKDIEQLLDITINEDKFFEKRSQFIDEAVAAGRIKLLPGAKEFINLLTAKNIPLFIATSSNREWPQRITQKLGIFDKFKGMIGREDVGKVKPAADLYLLALSLNSVAPQNAMVFEDSIPGIQAANAAGIRTNLVNSEMYVHDDFQREGLNGEQFFSFFDVIEKLQ